MKINLLLLSLFVCSFGLYSKENRISPVEYIENWKNKAIEEMSLNGIPASITLAQAMLESANGNSELAKNANNHFGIKCSNWDGPTYNKRDNTKSDCFRKYKNPAQSFDDHSAFLKNKSRYSFLFELETTDYKSWANGLKKAGYATNPNYPKLLIDLIEKYELYNLDDNSMKKSQNKEKTNKNTPSISEINSIHTLYFTAEKTKFVNAKKGDTFYRLCKEYSISLSQLHSYNDFPPKKDCLEEGDIVYLESKKKKLTKEQIVLKKDITVRDLSQQEGIRLKSLMKKNDILFDDMLLEKGSVLKLR
ncbi:MAG: glucosaminidase domain-containing protein [Flavobacteriia bacterium]|nr:glucosaminidase domain-containing protein [Flavobacteriia bacterium]